MASQKTRLAYCLIALLALASGCHGKAPAVDGRDLSRYRAHIHLSAAADEEVRDVAK
jgi:hypothetical protein